MNVGGKWLCAAIGSSIGPQATGWQLPSRRRSIYRASMSSSVNFSLNQSPSIAEVFIKSLCREEAVMLCTILFHSISEKTISFDDLKLIIF